MGTPGPEQKISMLGLEQDGKHFFAKYSTKVDAMALSRNEIKILSALRGTGLVHELYDYKDGGNYVFFRTSCVDGKNPTDLLLNDRIVALAIKINQTNLHEGALMTSLSHGDFTPWNVIISPDGVYRMIDWELADERELGYDIFTYITHVGALLKPEDSPLHLIDSYKSLVDKYFAEFGILDWIPYMKAFARRRIAYDKRKGEYEHAKKFETML
ncbi:phosphotransferase [Bacteroides sp.]|uniref:phosphotransferase n=1 Tax=Bacteroides sp. TaxID=29523 RepID=UPI00260A27F9|nr:phosphotransferase [Bacteroides sp.]MDD3040467.1 phosphotransferase [Bacteroides sp.]